MAIDTSTMNFGEDPTNGQEYIWRITGVFVNKSKNTGSLYISMNATISDGPSMGVQARVPMIMLYQPAKKEKTKQYIVEATQKLAKFLGISPNEVVLPSKERERTETIDALLNSLFVAKAKWQPESQDANSGRTYPAYWETGFPLRAVQETELEGGDDDFSSFFEN